jgi:hypothetical protein
VYAALTYDGRTLIDPTDDFDAAILTEVGAHQLTDKGFGPALGPPAAARSIERFESVGYEVLHGQSDWLLGPNDGTIQEMMFAGWSEIAAASASFAPPTDRRMARSAPGISGPRSFDHACRSHRRVRASNRLTVSIEIAIQRQVSATDNSADGCAVSIGRQSGACGCAITSTCAGKCAAGRRLPPTRDIDQRAQAMQMAQPTCAVDVMRVSG